MLREKPVVLFDLQALQNGSRTRGIGRYAREHALAIASNCHDRVVLHVAADLTYVEESQATLAEFATVLDGDRLHGYRYPNGSWQPFQIDAPGTLLAEELARMHVEAMAPDIVHVTSLFEGLIEPCAGLGAIARTQGSLTSCLVHDLIPLVMEERYLGDVRARRWYERKLAQLREFDVLLANSATSKQDAVRLLGIDPDRIHVVYAGFPDAFRRPDDMEAARQRLANRFSLRSRFVLYTGNNDYRKNSKGAIAGFAGLPRSLRSGLVLVMNQTEAEQELREFARQCGLGSADLVLTGYVEDSELRDLYALCEAFVFPSLYEGFGLPVVEAMACGAPVIVGDNSSLSEIVELSRAKFDATDFSAIAACLQQVLSDSGWREQLRNYGMERAGFFQWSRTADASVRAWSTALERHRAAQPHGQQAGGRVAIALPADAGTQPTGTSGWMDWAARLARTIPVLLLEDGGVREWPIHLRWGVASLADDRVREQADLIVVLRGVGGDGVRGLAFPADCASDVLAQWRSVSALMDVAVPVEGALPELLSKALGVFGHGDADPLLCVLAPLLPFGAVVEPGSAGGDADQGRLEHWIGRLRARIGHLGADVVAQRLMPHLPDDRSLVAAELRQALHSIKRFGSARRVLLDMSELAHVDYGTGIQRVVRNLVRGLCACNGRGRLLFVPVYHEGERIRSARALVQRLLGIDCPDFDERAGIGTRDLLFLADSAWGGPERFLPSIEQVHQLGGEVAVFVHDLIPLRLPHTCDVGMPEVFGHWMEFAARHADVFVCNSRSTGDDLAEWLQERERPRRGRQRVGFVHLGADVVEVEAGARLREDVIDVFGQGEPVFLAVGTLEPRKDYATILKAFELAWARGWSGRLMIVGKQGWASQAITESIRQHPRYGRQLFWPEQVSNAELDFAYGAAAGLIQASLLEGFGLPLVEAARYHLPLLLSDISVFREIAGGSASYFRVGDSETLCSLLVGADGTARPSAVATLSWAEYGIQLRELLLGAYGWLHRFGGA
ncbi:MAG: glycosyltransferase family 1 protein [Pseudomonas sp.]